MNNLRDNRFMSTDPEMREAYWKERCLRLEEAIKKRDLGHTLECDLQRGYPRNLSCFCGHDDIARILNED